MRTVALPMPDNPVGIETNVCFVVTDQLQLVPCTTVNATSMVWPAVEAVAEVLSMPNAHARGAASCGIDATWPPIVTLPDRAGPRFAATVTTTEPFPVPP